MIFSRTVSSPLGPLCVEASEKGLLRLRFGEGPRADSCSLLDSIEGELAAYFSGGGGFQTPLALEGTPFQLLVWEKLREIPFGSTWSYKELAEAIGRPTACRAVAQANGANPLPLIIPCHRVINSDQTVGGYSCGVDKKRWLLYHESGNEILHRYLSSTCTGA